MTLAGLTGAQTLDANLALVGPGGVAVGASEWAGDVAEWTLDGGVIVLTVGTGGLSAGVNYSLAFWLRNSATERAAPLTIQISVSIPSGANATAPAYELYPSPIAATDMTPATETVLGIVNAAGSTRNPKPETRNPKPETRNPKPETRNPKPETRNPKPETRNPKPETRNPKPEIRNPKPETRNPPPSTLNPQPPTGPFVMFSVAFDVNNITQSSPLAAASNLITVRPPFLTTYWSESAVSSR